MIVCICKNISNKEIELALNFNCKTLGDLQLKLGVCTQCYRCKESIEQIIREHTMQLDEILEGLPNRKPAKPKNGKERQTYEEKMEELRVYMSETYEQIIKHGQEMTQDLQNKGRM
jgi:bacterioferritin-associated ferredoxin